MNEDVPSSETGPVAEELAEKMLDAVNADAWARINYISWDFPGGHQYVWDRENNLVEVKWGEKVVLLPTKNPTSGRAWVNGKEVKDNDLLNKAWGYFCNDSFWLAAPFKVKDPGTERSIVTDKDGSQSLMVHYTSGGTTSGDRYLWHLDKNYMPTSYQMWVKIIPIGGISAKWDGWKTLPNGAKVSTLHDLAGVFENSLEPVKAGDSLEDIGLDANYFTR